MQSGTVIIMAIDYFGYRNPLIRVKTFFSLRARKKMFRQFMKLCTPDASSEILNLGTTPDMKLADSNYFEKQYPWKNRITIASIENCSCLVIKYGLKRFVYNVPKQPLPFRNKEFDILFCSAVLEHCGTREDQKFFLDECLRVAHKVFMTTPYRYFPVEMHSFIPFLHWLPWKWFQRIVSPVCGGFWADINNLNLLCRKDVLRMNNEVKVSFIRTVGMRSNMMITRIPDKGEPSARS